MLVDGDPVAAEWAGGGRLYTYNKTSASGSAILKLRWKNANAGTQFQISFDKGKNDKVNYMFGVQLYSAAADPANHPNGRVWLRPSYGQSVDFEEPIVSGQNYDIEFARLKVATGSNKDKYYVYLKMNGALIAEDYVNANVVDSEGNYTSTPNTNNAPTPCQISNEIYISFWDGGGGTITDPETYEAYDEVYYSDLLVDGDPVAAEWAGGGRLYTYNKTSASGSAILKLRWKNANAGTQFQISFDKGKNDKVNYMFGVQLYSAAADPANHPNGRVWLRPSYGQSVDFEEPIVSGQNYDIEFARLKVATGSNKDKYYVYLKINGDLIAEDYVAANVVDGSGNYTSNPGPTACQISNEIYISFWDRDGDAITDPETYEDYDEIGYNDLLLNGNPLPSRTTAINNKVIFKYNRTSETYSAVFKYCWTAGDPAKFSLSFDTNNTEGTGAESFPFCAVAKNPGQTGYGADAGENGAWQIDPSNNANIVQMITPLVIGNSYNIEFGRLKVKEGGNAGKYYVYLKVDGVLIKYCYVKINSIGTYISGNNNYTRLSNDIVFTEYNSNGNRIRAYGTSEVFEHQGVKGDFGDNDTIDTSDFEFLRKIVIGIESTSEMAEGIADFNNDGIVDIRDYMAMKRHLAPVNTYSKSGSLVIGTQEHLLEDETKTAAYIADATATLGAGAYRLSKPIHTLYSVTNTNAVTVNSANMAEFKAQIAALKAKGINEILYVTDSFILPYGYYDSSSCHHKTVPNPETETQNYIEWLNVNSLAFGALAQECPEIKYFEPFNEINLKSTRLEKRGANWNASESVQANYKYSTQEKVGIMADLCWYISKEVKAVDPANQVTTPSICVGSHIGSNLESNYLNLLYNAIESGGYPTDKAVGDKRIDNYFTIVNIHAYPEYSTGTSQQTTKVNTLANDINTARNTMLSHYDGGSCVWITETGVSSYGSGNWRDETETAALFERFLNKVNNDITYVDTVITYKLADMSTSGSTDTESAYGLFYAGDDTTHGRYGAKEIAKKIYSFTHNGSTDYSELTALANRYIS